MPDDDALLRSGTSSQADLLDEIVAGYLRAIESGETPSQEELLARHPILAGELREFFTDHDRMNRLAQPLCESTQFQPATTALSAEASGAAAPGTLIGPYKLLQQIGEGGMGVVYMAEQATPVRRQVALKIIKPGMDTSEVIARFEAERQALALMDHPNIARVFDAGATEAGRPYFVMELVRGVPITDYCDQNNLPVHERLELFVTVCHAVQHAHQKGIIHRDIKPSNVLVTMHDSRPVPKVIDFGVAKAIGQQLTEKTLFTQFAQMVGTPLYMSPEQAQMTGQDVDTRGDIYSLGVMLYELLTGTTPFERGRMKQAAVEEIRRMIREEDPPAPSTRLSSTAGEAQTAVAAHRRVDPRGLSRLVRGDLDWIVMRALEKDRTRRYETANAFAADIGRYLSDEPVEACPPSSMYRFRKFARRNRGAVLAASGLGIVLLVVLGTVAGSIGWAARDRGARQTAVEREADLALEEAQRFQEQKKWPEALASARRARGLLAGAIMSAETRQRIDDLEADSAMVLRLEEIHGRPVLPDFHTGVELDSGFARAFRDYGIDVENVSVMDTAERLRRRPISQELAMSLDDWAGMRKRQPGDQTWKKLVEIARAVDPDVWRTRFRDALLQGDRQGFETLAGSAPVKELPPGTLCLLGNALIEVGSLEKGMAVLREAQQRYPGDLWLNNALGATCTWGVQPPRYGDALRYYTAALAVRPGNYRLHLMVAEILDAQKSFDAAMIAYSRVLELEPTLLQVWIRRATFHLEQGLHEQALADFSTAIELDPTRFDVWGNRGIVYNRLGQLDKALADFSRAVELDPDNTLSRNCRGDVYSKQGHYDKALADFDKAIEVDPKFLPAWQNRGLVHWKLRQWDEAIAAFSRVIELDPQSASAWNNRGAMYGEEGRCDLAIADYSRAIEIDPKYATALTNRGTRYSEKGLDDKALIDLSAAIAADSKFVMAISGRAAVYMKRGECDKAADDCLRILELEPQNDEARKNLADCHVQLGRYHEAVEGYSALIERHPRDAAPHNALAWLVATCSDLNFRDPVRAVELARRAVELAPNEGGCWKTLGVAHYRARAPLAAIDAFQKSIDLLHRENAMDYFLLSMAHSQLDHEDEACIWYEKGVQSIEKNRDGPQSDGQHDEELKRFRAEAAELLGSKEPDDR